MVPLLATYRHAPPFIWTRQWTAVRKTARIARIHTKCMRKLMFYEKPKYENGATGHLVRFVSTDPPFGAMLGNVVGSYDTEEPKPTEPRTTSARTMDLAITRQLSELVGHILRSQLMKMRKYCQQACAESDPSLRPKQRKLTSNPSRPTATDSSCRQRCGSDVRTQFPWRSEDNIADSPVQPSSGISRSPTSTMAAGLHVLNCCNTLGPEMRHI